MEEEKERKKEKGGGVGRFRGLLERFAKDLQKDGAWMQIGLVSIKAGMRHLLKLSLISV